jgi:5-methylcytosine-specific restriction protein A
MSLPRTRRLPLRGITGKLRNHEWKVNALHALYREDGRWYHQLERFPGALFDSRGYVLFRTREEYLRCPYLAIGNEVNVRGGISAIPGYIRMR